MRSFKRVLNWALIGAGLYWGAQFAPANAACREFSGTNRGWDKVTAVALAQAAVAHAIKQYRTENKIRPITITAMRAKPQPYLRDVVTDDLFYKPDIVEANSYTVCWRGVVDRYVCTSGAKACWPNR